MLWGGTSKGTPPPIFSLTLSFCPSWEAVGPQNTWLTELRFAWAFAAFLFLRDSMEPQDEGHCFAS